MIIKKTRFSLRLNNLCTRWFNQEFQTTFKELCNISFSAVQGCPLPDLCLDTKYMQVNLDLSLILLDSTLRNAFIGSL